MRFFKHDGIWAPKRIAAVVAAFVMAVAVVKVGTTFAEPELPAVTVTLSPDREISRTVEAGQTSPSITFPQLNTASSSNTNLLRASANRGANSYTLTGVKAGVAAVALGTSRGLVTNTEVQVTDSGNISEYNLANGGVVRISNAGGTAQSPLTVPSGKGDPGSVSWSSLHASVATVSNSGTVTAMQNGSAVIVGKFTDKWGKEQTVPVLVIVGNGAPGGNTVVRDGLNGKVTEGEEIIANDSDRYTPESLDNLQDAVNDGKAVLNDPNATQDEIDEAADAIADAINGLRKDEQQPSDVIQGGDGNYYKPVGNPANVYEVVDEDGNSQNPPSYVYNPGTPGDGNNMPAFPGGGGYYAEEPENIYSPVKPGGSLDDAAQIWGGGDGELGGSGDEDVKYDQGNYWVHIDQNIWRKVDQSNPTELDPTLVGGGPSGNPGYFNVVPILEVDGKYYYGPVTSGGSTYYVGDRRQGGNGKVDSMPDGEDTTDERFYLQPDGSMTTGPSTPPGPSLTVTSVTIVNPPADVIRGRSVNFTADVTATGGAHSGVTWSLSGGGAGTSIDQNGTLTVAADENATSLSVTATSNDDASKTASASIAVARIGSVDVVPEYATVETNNSVKFTAKVYYNDAAGTENNDGVRWEVTGSPTPGTNINQNGELFIAMDETASSVTVRATSLADGSVSGTAYVTITRPATVVNVSVSPDTATVGKGEQSAPFTADVTMSDGSSYTGNVTWTVTGGSDGGTRMDGAELKVGANETATELRVKAEAGGKSSNEARVTVTDPVVDNLKDSITDAGEGGVVNIDNMNWHVVRISNGYAMLVAKGNFGYNVKFDASSGSSVYGGSDLQDLMTDAYRGLDDMKKIAVVPTFGDNSSESERTGHTTTPAGGEEEDILFAMSYRDALDLGNRAYNRGDYGDRVWLRTANNESSVYYIQVRASMIGKDLNAKSGQASVVPGVWVKCE